MQTHWPKKIWSLFDVGTGAPKLKIEIASVNSNFWKACFVFFTLVPLFRNKKDYHFLLSQKVPQIVCPYMKIASSQPLIASQDIEA